MAATLTGTTSDSREGWVVGAAGAELDYLLSLPGPEGTPAGRATAWAVQLHGPNGTTPIAGSFRASRKALQHLGLV